MENADTPRAFAIDVPYCPYCGAVMALPISIPGELAIDRWHRLLKPIQVICSVAFCQGTSMAVIARRI